MKLHWDEEDLDWDDTDLRPKGEDEDDMDPDDPLYTLFFDDD